jgi:lipid-A-disaccharide synthase
MDHIKYISLGNLIVDRLAFRELVQEDFTADAVLAEIRRLIEDSAYREKMLSEYSEIKKALGGGGASRAVAREMISLI